MRRKPIRLLVVPGALLAAIATLGSGSGPLPARAEAQKDAPPNPDLVPGRGQAVRAAAVPETSELLMVLTPEQDPVAFAGQYGMLYLYSLKSLPNAHVFATASPVAARQVLAPAAADPRIRAVYPNERTQNERMSFVPNDPYFHKDTPAVGWPGQWHLLNESVPGRDARVQGAWNNNVTGSGVTIGIVDDGLEAAHPDLAPNYVAADSWDFGENDGDPSPVNATDNHGISVAGVAAARGGNALGVTGAAPLANLAGLRIDYSAQTDAMFVDATLYHSSGANTSIKVKNHSYGIPSPYVPDQAQTDALATSAAAGTVHCLAAGNWRGTTGQDSNKKQMTASPDAITVAAMGSDGKFAYYSNFGACVFVTAPSGGVNGITTTDRTTEALGYNGSGDTFPDPDYTSQFGGTSSASPLVAGVMALVKQAQPALNSRFAKHLLAMTSDIVDAGDASRESDGGWKTNAAGYHFNQSYGFGLIDAAEMVQKAPTYSGVTPLTTASTGPVSVGKTIPDNNATGISRTFTLSATAPFQRAEEVLVTLNVTHPRRGNVRAYLTSPSGTTSRLVIESSSDTGANINWTFCSNAFWGENPAGTWTLNVRDVFAANTGTWNSYAVTARMGQLVAARSYSVTPSKASVTLGGALSVSFEAPAGRPFNDWVGLFKVGDPNTAQQAWWKPTAGAASGTFDVQTPSIPGDYEFRYFQAGTRNPPVAVSAPVSVTPVGAGGSPDFTLTPSAASVAAGSSLTISWTAPAGRASNDWIGLFKTGDADTGPRFFWNFTGGAASGSLFLTAPDAGSYEFRYLLEGSFTDVQRAAVTVTPPAGGGYSLTPSTTSVTSGGALSVTWTALASHSPSDWIVLSKVGDPNTSYLWWDFTGAASSGTLHLRAPLTPGNYEFRYLLNYGFTDVVRSATVTVTAPVDSSYTLTPSTTSVAALGTLSISWTAPPGSASLDWIGLFQVGDPNTAKSWFRYTGGATSGTLNLIAPINPGQYEFRYLLNNGLADTQRSVTVTVN